jgi:phosphate-selective porin
MERMDLLTQTVGAITTWLRTIGYYAEATFVVTGEDRLPNARIVPLHNLNFADGGWGALEVAARYGGVNLDSVALTNLTALAGANSNDAKDISFGLNWWLCQNMKICADYVREMFDTAIQTNTARPNTKHAEGFLMRFQVDF